MIAVSETQELVLMGEQTSKGDCKVISLSSWVAKIDTIIITTKLLAQSLWIFTLPLAEIDGGSVSEARSLILDDLSDDGMWVSKSNSRYSWNEVDVSVSLMIIEILVVSLRDQEWLLVIVEIKVRHVSGPVFRDLVISWASVGLGLMTYLGELERAEGAAHQSGDTKHVVLWYKWILFKNLTRLIWTHNQIWIELISWDSWTWKNCLTMW